MKASTNDLKFLNEINSVKNQLQFLFNHIRKKNYALDDLIGALEATVNGEKVANPLKELGPLITILECPEKLIKGMSQEGKKNYTAEVKQLLSDFITELYQEREGPQRATSPKM